MADWRTRLKYDPIAPLMESDDVAVAYFATRDLLERPVMPISFVHDLPEARKILRKQQLDGSWKFPGKRPTGSGVKYPLLETWKQLRFLVDRYEMSREVPAVEKAAEFVFSCQPEEGDIRGILANQYAPYYTGAIMGLLIKARYGDDPRILRGFCWLLDVRQADGGWVIGSPGMVGLGRLSRAEQTDLTLNAARETARAFDRSQPFSAAGTGMVIRAFAAHPQYRSSEAALQAACLLKSKFFREDNWTSYHHPDNWVRFQHPFWWNNLVAALDSLSLIGFSMSDDDVRNGVQWLIDHQQENGLWKASYSSIHHDPTGTRAADERLWISLAICRIMKRLLH